MADWNKIEAQMRKLISDANETTGKNDTNLTDIVDGLISGYGQGSTSGGISVNAKSSKLYVVPVLKESANISSSNIAITSNLTIIDNE